MYMTYHGGRCCGIKHIWGMVDGPNTVLIEQTKPVDANSGWSHHQYNHPRPRETAAKRLDAMIAFARMNWPEHIIEVVCADTPYQKQAQNWNDALIERGFKEVNRNINSNSTNTVVVYHLNVNDKEVSYEKRRKAAHKLTPTIPCYDANYQPIPVVPLKNSRKKATPLPEPVKVTIDGYRMVMAPEGGDVATPVPVPPRTLKHAELERS